MSYAREVEQERSTKQLLARLLFGAFIIIAALIVIIHQSQRTIRVDVRPGLTTRTLVREGELPSENVYSFALVIFQQLNRWREDGTKDYPLQIDRLRAFLTDRYRDQLKQDAERRKGQGELQYRARSMALPPEVSLASFSADRIKQVSPRLWIVYLDLELNETVRGQLVKSPIIRYPLRVVPYDSDSQFNPYGLLLDGFAEEPTRLSEQALESMGIVRKEKAP